MQHFFIFSNLYYYVARVWTVTTKYFEDIFQHAMEALPPSNEIVINSTELPEGLTFMLPYTYKYLAQGYTHVFANINTL